MILILGKSDVIIIWVFPYPDDIEWFSTSNTLRTFLVPIIGYLTLEIQSLRIVAEFN